MGNLPKDKEIGDLSWGLNVKKTCLNGGPSHNFSWYLKNVYPEFTNVSLILLDPHMAELPFAAQVPGDTSAAGTVV